jgi:hypothetical protein
MNLIVALFQIPINHLRIAVYVFIVYTDRNVAEGTMDSILLDMLYCHHSLCACPNLFKTHAERRCLSNTDGTGLSHLVYLYGFIAFYRVLADNSLLEWGECLVPVNVL